MPQQILHVGPFAGIYVGKAVDSTVLTQLTALGTGENRVEYTTQETFLHSAANSVQSGPSTITARLQFLSDDPDIMRLAMGNWLDATWQDTPPTFQKLILLLIHPDDTAESSFLIPTCYVQKQPKLSYSKTTPTTLELVFFFEDANIHDQLFYKRTPDQLATILSTRSPI